MKPIVLSFQRISKREPWWVNAILALELISGLVLTAWAVYGSLTGGLSNQPAYQILVKYIGSEWWLASSAMIGLSQIVFGMLDYRRMRGISALTGCLFWSMLADGVFQSTAASPSTIVFLGWSFANMPTLVLLRPRRN